MPELQCRWDLLGIIYPVWVSSLCPRQSSMMKGVWTLEGILKRDGNSDSECRNNTHTKEIKQASTQPRNIPWRIRNTKTESPLNTTQRTVATEYSQHHSRSCVTSAILKSYVSYDTCRARSGCGIPKILTCMYIGSPCR